MTASYLKVKDTGRTTGNRWDEDRGDYFDESIFEVIEINIALDVVFYEDGVEKDVNKLKTITSLDLVDLRALGVVVEIIKE